MVWDALIKGLSVTFSGSVLLCMALGIVIGMVFGSIPGLTATLGIVLLLPFIWGLPPVTAFAILLSLVATVHTSNTFPAVFFNVPGSPSAAATILDGYPMAKKGEAAQALTAAFIVYLLTALGAQNFDYSSMSLEEILFDLLAASVIVAASAAFISTIIAVKSYQQGYILSLRKRKSPRRVSGLFSASIRKGFVYSIIMTIFTGIALGVLISIGYTSFTFQTKETLAYLVAFFTTYFSSFRAIHGVRNGEIM